MTSTARPSTSTWKLRAGAVVLGAFAVAAAAGPVVVSVPALDLAHDLDAGAGVLGAGEGGVSVVGALVYGARASAVVAGLATVVALAVAVALGVVAGVAGGRVEAAVQRVVDVVLAFPSLLLALVLCAVLPPSPWSTVAALSLTAWAGPLRVIAGLAKDVAARDHVVAARALGAGFARVVVVHVAPLLSVPIAIQATQAFAGAVVAEASLAFLGLGPTPLSPPFYTSWGQQLDDGLAYLWAAPHLWWPPGVCIVAVAVAAQFVAEGLAAKR